jgi:proteic killer suppression protein
MIRRVRLTRRAKKQVLKLPEQVQTKLWTWVDLVAVTSVEEVRKIPGWHDESLIGPRRGIRSIRLNKAYRAIYRLVRDREAELVSVE